MPENWKEINKGEFYRSSSADDRTVLVQLGISGFTDDQLKVILSPKLSLEAFPNNIGGIKTKFFSWDFYKTEYQEQNLETLMVDIALTHDDNGAYVVLLQALPEEQDDLYYSIFLRSVDALEPISKNQFEKSTGKKYRSIKEAGTEVLLVVGEMLENEASEIVSDILQSEFGLSTDFIHLEDLDKIDYSGVKLIFFPGGECSKVRLSKKALRKLQLAVKMGMGYIGICCGAFLAAEAITMSNHLNIGHESLGIFPGIAEATGGNSIWPFYINVDHPILANSSFVDRISQVMSMKFVGGTTNIIPSYEGGLQNWRIATIDKPKNEKKLGKRAIITATLFGKGKVFLSGPHPEARADSLALILAATEWILDRSDPMSDQRPFIDAIIPSEGVVDYPFMTSVGSSNDPLGYPLGFIWDFGDSSPKQYRPEAIHIYEKSGLYTVSLTITTGTRQNIQSLKVVIHEH
ncbi:MAG: PKD domain-containing protein [Promethearchaeota archaeon]